MNVDKKIRQQLLSIQYPQKKKRQTKISTKRQTELRNLEQRQYLKRLRGQTSSLMRAEDRGAEKEAIRLQTKQLQIAQNEQNINAVIHCINKVEDQNIEMDIVFCNTALDIFANSDNYSLANKYFEKWFQQNNNNNNNNKLIPSDVTLNIMIKSCKYRGLIKEAMKYFCRLKEKSAIAYTNILTVCAKALDWEQAEDIFYNDVMKRLRDNNAIVVLDDTLIGSMLNVYSKCRQMEKVGNFLHEVSQLLAKMGRRFRLNEVHCVNIMSGYLSINQPESALQFYSIIINSDIGIHTRRYHLLLEMKCVAHLQALSHLTNLGLHSKSDVDHYRQFLATFIHDLYPSSSSSSSSSERHPISVTDMNRLIRLFIYRRNRMWGPDIIADIQTLLFASPSSHHFNISQDYHIRSYRFHLIDFHGMSTEVAILVLRFVMAFHRRLLLRSIVHERISVVCGKGVHSSSTINAGSNVAKQAITLQNELMSWQVPIRLYRHPDDPALFFFDSHDLDLFFKTFPPLRIDFCPQLIPS
ncbi:hypothetical protein RFI_30276 [Reticulomyxa filosa]|uniref:Smr domain-containing protein n=1 Tax=Reticulomyxa filosa TaxID=46433 RepID=X6M0H1_RETFI|nr:hypothetical protein RFI_30276 [Reticulomyxa filosa]|eukprot:ETO07116.1 hypothetical protein RFI_30276 [Reticulomyxa filosa]